MHGGGRPPPLCFQVALAPRPCGTPRLSPLQAAPKSQAWVSGCIPPAPRHMGTHPSHTGLAGAPTWLPVRPHGVPAVLWDPHIACVSRNKSFEAQAAYETLESTEQQMTANSGPVAESPRGFPREAAGHGDLVCASVKVSPSSCTVMCRPFGSASQLVLSRRTELTPLQRQLLLPRQPSPATHTPAPPTSYFLKVPTSPASRSSEGRTAWL